MLWTEFDGKDKADAHQQYTDWRQNMETSQTESGIFRVHRLHNWTEHDGRYHLRVWYTKGDKGDMPPPAHISTHGKGGWAET